MLNYIYFKGGSPRASSSEKSMEGVVELNSWCRAKINNYHHRLPQHLYQTYSTEVPISLWYQDDGLTVTLLHEGTLSESGLDQSYNLLPVGGVK